MGKLNTVDKTWTTDGGIVLPLTKVPAVLIATAQTDLTGQPKPPIIQVEIAGRKQSEENTADPEYLLRIEEWRGERNVRLMRTVLAFGVKNIEPDPAWIEEYGNFLPNGTKTNMRVYWIMSILSDEEATQIVEDIIGMSQVTPKGLTAAAETFPSDD